MQWIFRNESTPPLSADIESWARELSITPQLAKLLWVRGLHDKETMQFFLNPSLQSLAPLHNWPGLEQAGELIAQKLLEGQKLCVWGDYDVDGITSTALVTEFLTEHGFTCTHHIPNRLIHGYGLHPEVISQLHNDGVSILLTVDSGISDIDAITHAKKLGMTVIISDHHLPGTTLPPADAIVNPRLAPCDCTHLAGVGVAFFLMASVNNALAQHGKTKIDIRPLLDLVALGTLADVAELQPQNRILVKNGLLLLSNGQRVGLAALKSACNHTPTATLGAGQVVFALAPRLNAAGRLGSSESALELLLTKDRVKANTLAIELSRLNAERRDEEDRILDAAKLQAKEQVAAGKMGLSLFGENWHPGVIGIVASRIVEEFHRPTVVMCTQEAHIKGSGRSVYGFDIHNAFAQCASLLLGYGGHKMAAGLSLLPQNLEQVKTVFNQVVTQELQGKTVEPLCKLDGELSFGDFSYPNDTNLVFLKEMELMQPFGSGNAEPVFCSPPVLVKNMREKKQGFLLLDVLDEKSGTVLQAKAWRQLAKSFPPTIKGKYIRIAFTPRIDRYNGIATVELRLKDWKPVE